MENFLSQYGEMAIPDDCLHGVWLDKPCPDCVEMTQDEESRWVSLIIKGENYKPLLEEEEDETE